MCRIKTGVSLLMVRLHLLSVEAGLDGLDGLDG